MDKVALEADIISLVDYGLTFVLNLLVGKKKVLQSVQSELQFQPAGVCGF